MNAPCSPLAVNGNSADYDLVACSWRQAAEAIATWFIGSAIFAAVIWSWIAR